MRALSSVGNTPSGCSNLSSAAPVSASSSPSSSSPPRHDPTSTQPPPPARPQQKQLHHHHRLLVQQKQLHHHQPDSSRPKRNIRPSISPTTRNPAAASSQSTSRPSGASSPSPAAVAVNRKPATAQRRTTNNPRTTTTSATTSTPSITTAKPAAATAATTASAAAATAAAPTAAATGPPTRTGPRHITATASTTTKTSTTTANSITTSSPSPPPTTSASATPSSSSSSSAKRQQPNLSSSLRTPLRTRDQNVLNPPRPTTARAKPSPTPSPTPSASASASSTPTMPPYEKGGSTTTRQPAMPSLSAKAMNRVPLTPKVAAKSPPVVTPLGRRRNDNPNNSNLPPNPHTATAGASRDGMTSPAPYLAASNITPRSGSRQGRVNSANSTPNGTPKTERNGEWDRQPTLLAEPPRRQVVTFSPASTVSSRNDAAESKFFYASEAKAVQPAPQPKAQPKPQAAPQRGSTFMYANGSAIDRSRPTSPGVGFTPVLAPSLAPSLSPSIAPPPEPQSSKFFYANGAPNLQPGFRPSSAASMTGSVTSGSGKLPPARTSIGSAGGFPLAQRPLSPNKPAQPPMSVPLMKGNSLPPHAVGRAQMTSPPPLAPLSHKRRTSTDTVSQVASHVGSENPAMDAMIMSRFMASQSSTPSEMPSPTMPGFFPQQPITIASIIQAAEDLEEEDEEDLDSADESKDLEDLHSPTKSTHGDPLNDMVLNARRERKVQDLEITNASLEAINRSLERQLRKQTAELRRYKRLSRSGRLSIPSAAPSQVPTEPTTSGLGIDGLDLSDLSEMEEAEDFGDLDDSMFESSELSETDSMPRADPKEESDRDARRRTRDEKRLRLDLTKHRELLVDSQKINQSIKRCLNWTEELIKEGKKALEYSVRPSEVELPPRVLRPQYLDDNENDDQGQKKEGSIPSSPFESPKSQSSQWGKAAQDRDSGVELPADGG